MHKFGVILLLSIVAMLSSLTRGLQTGRLQKLIPPSSFSLARKGFTTKGFIDHVSRESKKPLRAEDKDNFPFESQSVEVEIVPDKGEPNAIVRLKGKDRTDALINFKQKGWALVKDRDAVIKTVEFHDFVDAFGFMSQIALVAEKLNHHPGNDENGIHQNKFIGH
jgi:hypothetical protein